MGFTEFTLSDGSNEVMIDVDVETGKIIDLYTYHDHDLTYYSEKKDDYFRMGKEWETTQNPLFVHCPKSEIKKSIKRLVECDLIVGSHYHDDGQEDLTAMHTFHKMTNFYNLPPYAFGS
jgi:hypothetical protein